MNTENKNVTESLFVPYEIAVKLKEVGFDEPCFNYYHNDNDDSNDKSFYLFEFMHTFGIKNSERVTNQGFENTISAPMYQQIVDWLSEKFNIDVLLDITYDNKNGNWYYYKVFLNGKSKYYVEGDFSKICALKEAIKQAFKLIKK